MTECTSIAWATSTFNPWIGCTKVGPGCDGCYAAVSTPARALGVEWGAGKSRRRTSAAYWKQPLAWNRKARESGKPWRVFCASLADVFDNEVPVEWRADLFRLIHETPALTWMLLTKRIGNVVPMIDAARSDGHLLTSGATPWPWPNVWIGATVVNQEEADRDIPKLLQVPAAVRFLSIEPMLEAIDLTPWVRESVSSIDYAQRVGYNAPHGAADRVDWVIVGGESDQPGHKARPFDIAWARDIVRQCKAAGVPVFVKQLGSNPIFEVKCVEKSGPPEFLEATKAWPFSVGSIRDRAGADPSEWPADLRVRESPR